jgi:hypothetical protein
MKTINNQRLTIGVMAAALIIIGTGRSKPERPGCRNQTEAGAERE